MIKPGSTPPGQSSYDRPHETDLLLRMVTTATVSSAIGKSSRPAGIYKVSITLIINRPGVAGADLQTAPSLINS